MGIQLTVYLHSLGCDKNLVDSEVMLGLLFEAGYKSASAPESADIIIVNTCGFIQEAVEEGIEAILELAEYKKDALIVTGCMAQRYRKEIEAEIPEVDLIIGVNDYPNLLQLISQKTGIANEPKYTSASRELAFDEDIYAKRVNTMPMHVAYVKISDGCDNRCTYCTIPEIRGHYREREFETLLAECNRLVRNGAKEIVLVAQDTARYGAALYGRPRLHELLQEIAKIDGLGWVRVMYAYPEHIYPELIDVIAGTEKVCKYLDMPIQHSHGNVIARMGRKGDTEDLIKLIAQLKEKNISIRTTLIAGFPGESEEEYNHLCRFAEEICFDHLGVFAYSREDGTPAAAMDHQIDDSVKAARRDEIMALQAVLADTNSKRLVGKTFKVMVDGRISEENDSEDGESLKFTYLGRSEREAYDTDGAVFFTSDRDLISGDYVHIKITKAQGYDVFGEEESAIED